MDHHPNPGHYEPHIYRLKLTVHAKSSGLAAAQLYLHPNAAGQWASLYIRQQTNFL